MKFSRKKRPTNGRFLNFIDSVHRELAQRLRVHYCARLQATKSPWKRSCNFAQPQSCSGAGII